MAALDGTEVMEGKEGSVLSPTGTTASALLQGQTPTNRVTGGFTDMIALFVPPAGSDQKVMLVATPTSRRPPPSAEQGPDSAQPEVQRWLRRH